MVYGNVVIQEIGLVAGCWAARVVAACVGWRDSVVAAWRSVKSVVSKILWVAVQVADFLSKRMFLTKNVLACGWMGSEAVRGAGLLAVVWVG